MSQSDENNTHQPATDSGDADMADRGIGSMLSRDTVGRRTLMKGIGASAAGAVAFGSDYGMVDDADALIGTTTVLVGGAIVASGVIGWALREYEVIGSNPPAEGLTAGALKQDVYQTARTRKSTNASTFVDNRNIIQSGLPNTLYAEGKIAAIEQLNKGASKSQVESHALNAARKYAATIEKNLLKSWNESVNEYESLVNTLNSHPDDMSGVIEFTWHTSNGQMGTNDPVIDPSAFQTASVTLADESSFETTRIGVSNWLWGPAGGSANSPSYVDVLAPESVRYLESEDWRGIWSDLQSVISNVESGLTTWVDKAYDQVQSGAIDVSELITPRERAKMIAADDGAAQAIADLYALGIPVDAGNKYTITVAETGATIRGTLATTDDSQSIQSGSTYDPSADTFSGDAFFTYDLATAHGDWSAYEQGINGGVVTFTEEPYDGALFEVSTSKNETVSVSSGNFTPVDSNGAEVEPRNAVAWQKDFSEDLENDIADVAGVEFYSNVDESQMETVPLTDQFTVDKIVNAETDEQVDSASFEQAKAQTDSNYITKEEWNQLEEQNQELIEKYKASQNTGGGGINLGQFDMFGLPGELIALGAAGAAILLGKSN